MPLYEYECPECRERVERIVSMQSADEATCERCGAKLRRLLSVIAGLGGSSPDPSPPVCGRGACGACS